MESTEEKLCPCGKPLHYSDPTLRRYVEQCVRRLGEDVVVKVGEVEYSVPRHYIALHGIRGNQMKELVERGIAKVA